MRLESGISIRESQVRSWLGKIGFKGEYLLVSTKEEVGSKRSKVRGGRLIVDLYTPLMLEKQVSFKWWNPYAWRVKQVSINNIKSYLLAGNHFLVANRRQREYWIKAAGDLGVKLAEKDISVLPTGSFAIRKKEEGRRKKARNVVLWFGGIYPWMEPGLLVEAFSRLAAKFPDWKLRFLGGWHPETGYKGIYRRLKEFSERMIPQDRLEFIPWQKEKDLVKYFRDVAFAVHLAKPTPEDYYAHRVRLLTLLSVGIPVLTSGRDVISDLAVRLGAAVRTEAKEAVVKKDLSQLMGQPEKLSKIRKHCLRVEREFLKQEKDIQTFSNS